MAPIEIPVPGLVLLIGAAGSGKSTLAARLFEPDEVLSSDQLREAVGRDAADQGATRPAFAILHREVRRRLAAGRLVVVDATNVERSARLSLVRIARAAGAPTIAVVLAVSAADAHARNLGRARRIVPAEIVDRHLDRLAFLGDTPAAMTAALRIEGFTAATVLATPADLDGARVVRRVRVPLSPP